ncbi:glycerate kinase [Lewinellaceae bacterium SD302]|nr:glycerate kinase [Lewinellaceae bacterium SD302]
MKILICPDKFKGSLTALEVGEALTRGIRKVRSEAQITIQSLADGGDGSLAVLRDTLGLQEVSVDTFDHLRRRMRANYFTDGKTAYVELAAASGLALLAEDERDPMKCSTYGTGLLIKHALDAGAERIRLFLDGSATHDLGFGIAAALGFRFLALSGKVIRPNGAALELIRYIEKPTKAKYRQAKIELICDVRNPLLGENGAARIYAPQKGADALAVERLEYGSQSSSGVIEQQFGRSVTNVIGGGAAGGIAAGLYGLFGAEIVAGFPLISELVGLEDQIAAADLVISGEGKLDGQSLEGKVVSGVAELCQRLEKTLILVVGHTELEQFEQVTEIYAVSRLARDLADSMGNAGGYLEEIGEGIANSIPRKSSE